ncbi:MAG: tRNA (adenosine(37)-N6)-threonylcarbamoyltransferase complex dimerization subunit type 1 TsaB, partial [Phototrophicales bacterium]
MPPKILAIESATTVCSVALYEGDKCIGIRESTEVNAHSRYLMP